MHIAFLRQKWLRVPDIPDVPIELNLNGILLRLSLTCFQTQTHRTLGAD